MSGTKKKATLTDDQGRTVELDILDGTAGPRVIDVRKLYGTTGYFTYDPGYTSTGSCESRITYIDGDKGILLHRGYPIEQLAEKSDFMEVCYLLLNGDLPTRDEKEQFVRAITLHTMVHEQINYFFRGFRRDAHPMAVMCGVVGALAAFYHDSTDINDPVQRMIASHRLVAKMPTIAALAYKYSVGQPFMYPRNDLDEDPVHRPRQDRVDLVFLARHREHHMQEVLGVGQVVARIHEGLADGVFVGQRGDGRHLRHQAYDVRGAVRGIQDQPGPGAGDGPDPHPPCRP